MMFIFVKTALQLEGARGHRSICMPCNLVLNELTIRAKRSGLSQLMEGGMDVAIVCVLCL